MAKSTKKAANAAKKSTKKTAKVVSKGKALRAKHRPVQKPRAVVQEHEVRNGVTRPHQVRRNGNGVKVWSIADKMYAAKKGKEVPDRQTLLNKAEAAGVPRATASQQFHYWQHFHDVGNRRLATPKAKSKPKAKAAKKAAKKAPARKGSAATVKPKAKVAKKAPAKKITRIPDPPKKAAKKAAAKKAPAPKKVKAAPAPKPKKAKEALAAKNVRETKAASIKTGSAVTAKEVKAQAEALAGVPSPPSQAG